MGRFILLAIGFIAGWFLKDSNWEEWLQKLKDFLNPPPATSDPIPLLEEKEKETPAASSDEVLPDPLEQLTGIGPAAKKKLNENGIYTFKQIAALDGAKLKEIVGARVKAEEAIKQATELSK